MQSDVHQRARFLIEETLIAGLSEMDNAWLRNHTSHCAECAEYAESTAILLRGLCSLSFEVDPEMNRRVQDAVVAQARQLTTRHTSSPESHDRVDLLIRQRVVALSRRVALAAAILIALAAPSVYQAVRGRQQVARIEASDELLLESIGANVSRSIPEVLEPLRQPPPSDASNAPGAGRAGGSQ